jgi:predicted transposase YbfD/YdcC
LVEREVFDLANKTTRIDHAYLVTSLSPQYANPEQLLKLNRGHWGIENRLHYVRDMAFDEDRCRARKGSTPQVLAALRNFTISLLRLNGFNNITATLRALAAQPAKILHLLKL